MEFIAKMLNSTLKTLREKEEFVKGKSRKTMIPPELCMKFDLPEKIEINFLGKTNLRHIVERWGWEKEHLKKILKEIKNDASFAYESYKNAMRGLTGKNEKIPKNRVALFTPTKNDLKEWKKESWSEYKKLRQKIDELEDDIAFTKKTIAILKIFKSPTR